MALSDPIAITINGLTSFDRTGFLSGGHGAEYTDNSGTDNEFGKLTFSHQYGKRIRRIARVDYNGYVNALTGNGEGQLQSKSLYVVSDEPASDQLAVSAKDIYTALHGFLSASTYAQFDKWAAGQF